MFHWYDGDGYKIKNGFNVYRISNKNSAGFVFNLGTFYLRARYSKVTKKIHFSIRNFNYNQLLNSQLKQKLKTHTLAQILMSMDGEGWSYNKKYTINWLPRLCIVSNKLLFLQKAYKFTVKHSLDGIWVSEHCFWVSEKETVLTILRMAK